VEDVEEIPLAEVETSAFSRTRNAVPEPVVRSFADGLVNRHGAHMKSTAPTLPRTVVGLLRFLLGEVGFGAGSLILENSDVGGSRLERDVAFGRTSQLFELALISTTPERTAPRCR
jgi:hypothetical protein